jgi:hypothetical protein
MVKELGFANQGLVTAVGKCSGTETLLSSSRASEQQMQ